MRYVFDASALVNLAKRGCLKVLIDGVTLDLAAYETLNSVWKEEALLGRIDRETAKSFVRVLSLAFRGVRVTGIASHEAEVYRLASEEKITVYDAAYLWLAVRENLVLVTDDKKLREKAGKYVEAVPSSTLEC